MIEHCFLCLDRATDRDGGTAWYRFYSKFTGRWESQPICASCFTSLNGPDRTLVKVYPKGKR